MTIEKLYEKFLSSTGVATDTREIEKGTMFFALKGENFNGNKFASQALKNGAYFAIIDEKEFDIDDKCILVENVLKTLQALSAFHRNQFSIPIIGITGSNGKTTTKELIKAALSTKFNVFATKGNFNNHIGVPLSLLSIKKDTEIAIIEMGANHVGEIASYCEWVKPTLGLITNIGNAHLEGFGSFENIVKAKTELYNELKNNDKIIFYNDDDALIKKLVANYTYKISYGLGLETDTRIELINSFPTIKLKWFDGDDDKGVINTNLFGAYNISNITVAIALASYFDVSLEYLKIGLENYFPKNNRSEILQKNSNLIILDAYNANPTSVMAAVDSFANLEVDNKIVFIGDMFELGKETNKLHQEIVDYIESFDFEEYYFVGELFFNCLSKKKATFLKTTLEAKELYGRKQFKDKTILIKGSRGMKMESLVRS